MCQKCWNKKYYQANKEKIKAARRARYKKQTQIKPLKKSAELYPLERKIQEREKKERQKLAAKEKADQKEAFISRILRGRSIKRQND